MCTGPPGSPPAEQKKKKHKAADSEAVAADSAAELSKAQKAVKALLKLKVAAIFSSPVSEEDVPGYSNVIQYPMDLGTVLEKLKNGEYSSAGSVAFCAFLAVQVIC